MSKHTKTIKEKRPLTEDEIDDILSFITHNPEIPFEVSDALVRKNREPLVLQLRKQLIKPSYIPILKKEIKKHYFETLIAPGECVGIITAQSICERQTQSNLSNFHKAGSSDKQQPVVSKFKELLSATNKPKAPSYTVYFNEDNNDITKLRTSIGNSIVQILFSNIVLETKVVIQKVNGGEMKENDEESEDETESEDEEESENGNEHNPKPWYSVFECLKGVKIPETSYLSYKINMEVLYKNNLTLAQVSAMLTEAFTEITCVYSPDCFHTLDIYPSLENIELPKELEKEKQFNRR
jgi:hypothetical protein